MEYVDCFVDLDGLGADWEGYVLSRHFRGMSINALNKLEDRHHALRAMYRKEPRLFYNLPRIPQFGELLARLTQGGIRWQILTAAGEDHPSFDTVRNDKVVWLKHHFGVPHHRVTVTETSACKLKFAGSGKLLVDDYDKNCALWEQAGGKAIWVESISYCPKVLANKVIESCLM